MNIFNRLYLCITQTVKSSAYDSMVHSYVKVLHRQADSIEDILTSSAVKKEVLNILSANPDAISDITIGIKSLLTGINQVMEAISDVDMDSLKPMVSVLKPMMDSAVTDMAKNIEAMQSHAVNWAEELSEICDMEDEKDESEKEAV